MASFYFRITTRCNMRCPHCCFQATSRGQDMSWDTFLRACSTLLPYNRYEDLFVTLGGGEPTLNPLVLDMANHILVNYPHVVVGVVTNGTRVRRAMALLDLHRKYKDVEMGGGFPQFSVRMSGDQYHDWSMVSDTVRRAYKAEGALSEWLYRVLPVGRGKQLLGPDNPAVKDLSLSKYKEGAMCCGPEVWPNGDVHACMCEDAPVLGNVVQWSMPGNSVPGEVFYSDSCYKQGLEETDGQ